MLTLILPFPPSFNNYWLRTRRGGVRLSDRGVAFRQAVRLIVLRHRSRDRFPLLGDVTMTIELHQPRRGKYDWDNFAKATSDALTHAGVYLDDSQVRLGAVEVCAPLAGGAIVVGLDTVSGERRGWDPGIPLPEWCVGKKLAKARKRK